MRPLSATAALRLRSPQVTVTQPETTVQPASRLSSARSSNLDVSPASSRP